MLTVVPDPMFEDVCMDFGQLIECFDQPAWVWSMDGALLANNPSSNIYNSDPLPDLKERLDIIAQVQNDPAHPIERMVPLASEHGGINWHPCMFKAYLEGQETTAIIAVCAKQTLSQVTSPPALPHSTPKVKHDYLGLLTAGSDPIIAACMAENATTALFKIHIQLDGSVEIPFVNAELAHVFGISPETLEQNKARIFDQIHEDEQPRLLAVGAKSMLTGQEIDFKFRIHHAAFGIRWLHALSRPQLQNDGTTIYYGHVEDITEKVEAEAKTRAAIDEKNKALLLLNQITERIPSGLSRIRFSADGERKVEYFNSQLCELLGITPRDSRNSREDTYKNVFSEDQAHHKLALAEAEKTMQPVAARFRVNHPTRGQIWILSQVHTYPQPDGGYIMYSNYLDITDQVALEQEARDAHDRIQRIADTVPVGFYETRLLENGRQSIHYGSKKYFEFTGIQSDDPEERFTEFYQRVDPDDGKKIKAAVKRARETQGHWEQRFRMRHGPNKSAWLKFTGAAHIDKFGNPAIVGAVSDITAEVEREEALRRANKQTERIRKENEHLALHDSLTSLPNRRFFDLRMNEMFKEAKKNIGPSHVTLVRVDGDRFKYINDTFGHETGDAVLAHIGKVMLEQTRDQDFPARVGGDEFSILLFDDEAETRAAALVERVRKELSKPVVINGNRCKIQASFGVATVDASGQSQDDLLIFADAALYKAKESGRNRMQLFTPELRQEITDARQIVSDLHSVIERDEIEPYFQVQVDSKRKTISGIEALIRWNHPSRGLLLPDRFLPIADKLRMTAELDRHMKEKSHQVLLNLRSQGIEVPRISFNASLGRFQDGQIVSDVKKLINDGFAVTVELLESVMVEDEDDKFQSTLDALREIGVDLEIDDFGSGRASVLGLLQVQPAALKIDQRLIMNVEQEQSAQNLVRAIVDIANALNISTICEGVEREGQVKTLQALGCNIMQGFYFSKALPASSLANLLRSPPWTYKPKSRSA